MATQACCLCFTAVVMLFKTFCMLPDHIILTDQPTDALRDFLAAKTYSQVVVVVDENTRKHCYPILKESLATHSVIETKSGEAHKNLETCTIIWQQLTELQIDRHAVLIIVGGGVLGDMAGFCAATYKRGIELMLVPTTLLAQADASIGGKLGIDFNHYKNHIGVFQQPVLTLLYPGFLKTLPESEIRSGFAEVIKHALISDEKIWNEIRQKKLSEQNWSKLLKHSAEFKYSVIQQDPTEKGIRKILNAGHTIGHALESYLLSVNRKVMHGEAVAAGLLAESFIATEKELISSELLNEIGAFIHLIFGKIEFQQNEIDLIAEFVLQDKKNKDKVILCVLQKGAGRAGWDYKISLQDVKRALSFYLAY
jgi:3-dehydroquinate synthase